MKILLASPVFSQHYDAGLFWAAALSRQGHSLSLWDYRLEDSPPIDDADLSIVFKGLNVNPDHLKGKKVNYWPDAFDRTPNIVQILERYDRVYTPVRPTPDKMTWLPTGWEPLIHSNQHSDKRIDSVFIGTGTSGKRDWLKKMKPTVVFGNDWNEDDFTWEETRFQPPVYLWEYVAALNLAKVSINLHRDKVGVNRRFFESIACTFTITDDVPGVREILGEELAKMVVFSTPEEGQTLLHHYLNMSPPLRETIWELERRAVLPYTYDQAASTLLKQCMGTKIGA